MRLLLLLVLNLSCRPAVVGFPPDQSSRLQRSTALAESQFGPAVKGHPHLFELNNEYVLKLQFTEGGEVGGVLVTPKYYYGESVPEWKEPDHPVSLSAEQYREVFSRLERLRELGPLVSRGSAGVVTNSRLRLLDQYQNAFVQRSIYRTAQSTDGPPELVHAFSVYFIHPVEGVVEDRKLVRQPGAGEQAKVKIEGDWYLTTPQEFHKAEPGRRVSLNVAGPLSDTR